MTNQDLEGFLETELAKLGMPLSQRISRKQLEEAKEMDDDSDETLAFQDQLEEQVKKNVGLTDETMDIIDHILIEEIAKAEINDLAKKGELKISLTFAQAYITLPEFMRVSSINNGYGVDFSYYSNEKSHLYLRFEAKYAGQRNIQDLEFYNPIMKLNFLFCAHIKGDMADIGPQPFDEPFEWFKARTGSQDQDQFNQYKQWLEEIQKRFQDKCASDEIGKILVDFLKPRVLEPTK